MRSLRILKSSWLSIQQNLAVQFTYRLAFAQGVVFSLIGVIATIFFWKSAGQSSEAASLGYTPSTIAVYFIVASIHEMIQENNISRQLALDIRSGKMSASLVKPFPYLLIPITKGISHAIAAIIMMAPWIALGFTAIPILHEFADQFTIGLLIKYFLTLGLALVLGWLIKIFMGLLAFHMTQTWGPELLYLSSYFAFSGIVYPIDLLPASLAKFVTWTPLYYLQGFPNLVFLGRIHDDLYQTEFLRGCFIAAILTLLTTIMWRRGVKQFEAIGI